MRKFLIPLLALTLACATAPRPDPEAEWAELSRDYRSLVAMRQSLPRPPARMARREQIELLLANEEKTAAVAEPLLGRIRGYFERTGDPRAGKLLAVEYVRLGDAYMNVLARYERAIELYRAALAADPSSDEVRKRIALAESRRFVSMDAFARIRDGMSERDVEAALGIPREDWIKHVRQDRHLYSVWIYPRADDGAAAVYFDNGIVYHTNWNAAAPPPAP
ncbi:MAG: tetratricopeptide repeat protein [Thermoanaerobaculia bacterium]